MKSKKQLAFKRDDPDLPDELELNLNAAHLFSDPDTVLIEDQRIADLEQNDQKIGTLLTRESILERIKFRGTHFSTLLGKDVQFSGCDLANARGHRISLVRVELDECRLTGFIATTLECQDVLFRASDLSYGQFSGAKFKACEFDSCNFQDSDLRNADLTGCVLRSCQFARADLRGARLNNVDLRKSDLEGLVVNAEDLRGAIVEPAQAIVLAQAFGLQIT